MALSTFQSFMYLVLKNYINEIIVVKLAEMCEKELNLSDEKQKNHLNKYHRSSYYWFY